VLKYHNYSISRALIELFPNIGLKKEKFHSKPNHFSFLYYFINFYIAWNPQNSRQFFEKYAKDHGFDPLIPKNWYSVSYRSILSKVVCLTSYSSTNILFVYFLGRT
jgi:hypothetical protein